MIKQFLMERRSWILFILFLQFLTLFIAFIDTTIPFLSLLYITFLSSLIFILFLFVRYQKETRFYRSLIEREDNLDLATITYPDSPFEKVVEESITRQTEQLKQAANQNLLQIEQEKDDILSWIHEVKTPLTAMNLMIERLEDEKIRAQLSHEWLKIHLLLDQQLHLKRMPFMENDLYIEDTNLKTTLYKEIKMLQSWCFQKRIGFDVQLEVTNVLTDAKWLAFILRQLLTNAIKYSDSSDITIKTYQLREQVILEITDEGIGIVPQDLPRIFDKGFTSTVRHQDQAATGMGLYLVKKIAHILLIDIKVDSCPGIGTTFSLTFPKRNEFVKVTSM